MLNKASEIFKKHINGGDRIGVSVSGGSDSMALIDLILRFGLADKKNILVINFEHGLRGEESLRDSRFVADYCTANGLALYCKSADIRSLAEESGRSEETEARLFRRGEYEKLIREKTVDYILLAHNAGDRTESVLMHIFRGCGLKGLVGMGEKDGYIIRPLITTTKEEILGYVAKHSIGYVEDSTNAENNYTRNYLRNEILPLIRKKWNGVDDALCGLSAAALGAIGRIKDGREATAGNLRSSGREADGAVIADGDSVLVPLKNIDAFSLFEAFSKLGVNQDITQKHIAAVLGLADSSCGAGVDLPHNLRAVREYDEIRIFIKTGDISEPQPFTLGETLICGQTVSISECATVVAPGRLRFDLDKLPVGAVLRTRLDGDRFRPCGGRNKLLSDYLTDKKMPVYKRGKLALIAYGNEILAIAGIEISDKIKLDAKTKRAAEITETLYMDGKNE